MPRLYLGCISAVSRVCTGCISASASAVYRLSLGGTGGRPLFFDGVSPSDELLPQKRALLAALGAAEGARP